MKRFIKMNVNINSALSPEEISILVALCEQDFVMQKRGTDRGWSKNYLMEISNLGRKVFDRASSQLVQKRLLTFIPREGGGRNQYLLNHTEYDKMNDILYMTNNRAYLNKFFKNLWKEKRAPSDITKEEELGLTKSIKHWKTSKTGKSTVDISKYYENPVCENQVLEEPGLHGSNKEVPGLDKTEYQKNPVSDDMSDKVPGLGKSGYHKDSVSKKQVPEELGLKVECSDDTKPGTLGENTVLSMLESIYDAVKDNSNRISKLEADIIEVKDANKNRVPRGTRFSETETKPGTTWGTGIYKERKDKEKKEKSFFKKKETKKLNNIGNEVSTFMGFGNGSSEKNNKTDRCETSSIKENKPNMDILTNEDYAEDIFTVVQYFRERYPSGSADKIENVKKFYEELKDDYWYFSDELMKASLTDVFSDFKIVGNKVFMFYEKTDNSAIELSNEELKEFNSMRCISNDEVNRVSQLSDNEKIDKITEWFNEDYTEGEGVELNTINKYVISAMRDINSPVLNGIKYTNPRLAPLILHNILPVDDAQVYWYRDEAETQKSRPKMANIISTPSIKSNKGADFWIDEGELKSDNIYFGIFDDFRITRRMDISNIRNMMVLMAKFAFIEPGTTISLVDMQKLMYAAANKISVDYKSSEFMSLLGDMFVKIDNDNYKIEYNE